jgi:hypothetical protein
MSIPKRDPNFTVSDLQKSAQRFVDAAYAYWEDAHKAGIEGAVVWVKTTEGCVIFTRGEYLHELLKNVEKIYGPTVAFGSSIE